LKFPRRPAAIIASAIAAGVCTIAAVGSAGPRERTVEITIHHSRFSPTLIEAEPGETVRFVVRNEDPIAHELIVGPMSVQQRHESGREAWHPPVPGEVSVDIFSTAVTTYTFDDAGPVWFGCHLPGHWDYGMQGRIVVG
jgi:uncharacterized cupredoxin-like copper-binding protein